MPALDIIFASSSPRRKELVQKTFKKRIKFVRHRADEKKFGKIRSVNVLKKLACLKAASVADKKHNAIVIAADTEVFLNNKALGKPGNAKSAKQMLKKINNRRLLVATAVAICDTRVDKTKSFVTKTVVKIKKLSPDEISWYVGTGEPLGKAGGFAVQGKGALLIERIGGDYFNVVGLPVGELYQELKKRGIDLN